MENILSFHLFRVAKPSPSSMHAVYGLNANLFDFFLVPVGPVRIICIMRFRILQNKGRACVGINLLRAIHVYDVIHILE